MTTDAWRIWRLEFAAAVGDTGIAIREIEFRISGTDQTSPGVAYTVQSKSFFSGAEPLYAFDNNTGTPFYTDFTGVWPQWIQYDLLLGNDDFIDTIAIWPDNNLGRAPTEVKVLVSEDGVNFTQAANFTGLSGTWTAGAYKTFAITSTPAVTPITPTYPVIESCTATKVDTLQASIVVNKPSGLADGDLLFVAIGVGDSVTDIAAPDGTWTKDYRNSGTAQAAIFWKPISSAAGEASTYTFTFTGSSKAISAIYRISGADATTILKSNLGSASNTNPIPSPALDVPDGDGRLLLCFLQGGFSGGGYTATVPTGMTQDFQQAHASGGADGCLFVGAHVNRDVGGSSFIRNFVPNSGLPYITFTVAIAPMAAAPEATTDLIIDYAINIEKSFILDYEIFSDFASKDLILDYAIEVISNFIISYSIPTPTDYFYSYLLIYGASGEVTDVDIDDGSASVIEVSVFAPGTPEPPDHPVGDTRQSFRVLAFYGDYYLRIWQDPTILRLSNPRYNSPIAFHIWSAYPTDNDLVETIATDLPGLVLNYTMPLTFHEYEYKTLTFSITTDAPATLNGEFEFIFDQGQSTMQVVATIVSVMRARPDEPVQETWRWDTALTIAKGSPETRAARRIAPRYGMQFTTTLIDDDERRVRYNQLWTFLSRDQQVPLYQYRTPLTATSLAGSNRIYFDPSKTDVRDNEYFVLLNTYDDTLTLVTGIIEVDGATLDGSIAEDIGPSFQVVPTVSMRLFDGSGLVMDAINGTSTVSARSTKVRSLLNAPISPSLLVRFDDVPVIENRMIAQNSLNDEFDQDVEAIDGAGSETQLYTQWPQPFVEGVKEFLIDRDIPDEINWWREFGGYSLGSQNPFLLPTWRNDLTLSETPVLGSSTIRVNEADFINQFSNGAYSRLQLLSVNGIRYVDVTNVEDFGSYIEVTLGAGIGSDEGDEDIQMISYLNLCRIADDLITLTHYVNHTVVALNIRTINA